MVICSVVVCRLLSEVFFQYRVVLVLFGIVALIKLLSCNFFGNVFCLILIYLVSSKLICFLSSCSRLLVAPDELGWMSYS